LKSDEKNQTASPARRNPEGGSGSKGRAANGGRKTEAGSGSRSAEMMKKTTGATRATRKRDSSTGIVKNGKRMTDPPGAPSAAPRKPTSKLPAAKPAPAPGTPAVGIPAAKAAPRPAAPNASHLPTPKELAAETVARALHRIAPRSVAAETTSPEPVAAVAHGGPPAPPSPDYPPFFGELDLYLTGEGKHFRLWEKMGAHPHTVDGVDGVMFAVWAPNAGAVSVIGAFNEWDGRRHPMRGLGNSGIWSAFVPGLKEGDLYKYEIRTREGHLRIKSDPYAFYAEVRPASASVVWDVDKYAWHDEGWMAARRDADLRHQPMSIYEVHLASWMRAPEDNDRWLNYRELAPRLVDHLKRYNFTHVELLPVAEHLLDQSWGYQVTGYFAPTSRHGTPDDFKFLVDLLHQNGIGVIVDWVPAHFPKDESGLRWFDGTALYEHADPRQGEHRDWGTLIFNYGRHEVRNFLLANALFWLDVYHIDGLRVDAVASMLYLDYSREEGDWLPNRYGGRENIEAIDFVRRMNELVYGEYPGAFTIAEESTDWGGVTMPTSLGGLGFGFKWDMGWMHDTLLYFSKDPVHRAHHQNDLTFAMLYAYTENFIMPLSHDEVVHGKGSLIGKMPGDEWQRYANLRALYAYMFTRPGKKLLFMGAEFAQSWEWRSDNSLDWHLTAYAPHKGIELLLEDLGRLYRSRDALWAWDTEPQGYQWIDCSDGAASVLSYVRRGPSGFLVTVLNLTPVPRMGYRVGVPSPGYYREVLNTDSELYGGSNLGNGGGRGADGVAMHGQHWSLDLTLPPLAAVVFELAT
jgi:1,4-alpha-glucan branching enzyme